MFSLWTVTGLVATYLLILFALAFWGEKRFNDNQQHPWIYSLAMGGHCTSWAFFGTTTQASQYGWAFIPTYLGIILVMVFFITSADSGSLVVDTIAAARAAGLSSQHTGCAPPALSARAALSPDRPRPRTATCRSAAGKWTHWCCHMPTSTIAVRCRAWSILPPSIGDANPMYRPCLNGLWCRCHGARLG